MQYKRFDVVELKDNNRATILETEKNKYLVEVVNAYGIILNKRYITKNMIKKLIYSKDKIR